MDIGQFEARKTPLEANARPRGSARRVHRFYAAQNDQIDAFVDLDRTARGQGGLSNAEEMEAREEESRRLRGVQIAIYGSFILNMLLFLAKIVAVVLSGSISLIASAVDSFLDLISGSIIFITSCLMRKKSNVYLYPAGNTRIEPIGVLIFVSAMCVATLQVITQAIQATAQLASLDLACPIDTVSYRCNSTCTERTLSDTCQVLSLDTLTLSIIGATVIIKFLMYLYCIGYRSKSSSVRALATDHITDVVSNLILLGFYVGGFYLWGYLDALGGLLISIYLIFNWYREGAVEVAKLSGQSAPPEFLRRLTFLSLNHSRFIIAVDTVRAFHLANGFLVELDIVLPLDMPLNQAHDIGESLQLRIEALSEVERAYVHLDFETDHVPSSEHPAMHVADEGFSSSVEDEDASLIPLERQWDEGSKIN